MAAVKVRPMQLSAEHSRTTPFVRITKVSWIRELVSAIILVHYAVRNICRGCDVELPFCEGRYLRYKTRATENASQAAPSH